MLNGSYLRSLLLGRIFSGVVAFSGSVTASLTALFSYLASGILSSTGSVSRLLNLNRPLGGTLTFAGDYLYSVLQAGIKAWTGAGTLTIIGNMTRALDLARAKNGVLSVAGSLTRFIISQRRPLSGVLSFVGSAVGSTIIPPLTGLGAGILSLSAQVSRRIALARRFAGSLSPTGEILTVRILKYLANQTSNVLSFAGEAIGDLAGLPTPVKAGVLSFLGNIAYTVTSAAGSIQELRGGALSFAGSISTVRIYKLLANQAQNVLSFAGSVAGAWAGPAHGVSCATSSALSFLGEVTQIDIWHPFREIIKNRALSFIGTLSYVVSPVFPTVYSGVLSFAGSITRKIVVARTKAGTVSFAGTVRKFTGDLEAEFAGTLSFIGEVVGRKLGEPLLFERTLAGAISFVGSLSRTFERWKVPSGSVSFSGRVVGSRYIETLYFGVAN